MPVCLFVPLSVLPYVKLVRAITGEIFLFFFLKVGWNFLWVNVSDKFDDGYCSSFDMDIIELIFVMSCFLSSHQFSTLLVEYIMNATRHNHEPEKL